MKVLILIQGTFHPSYKDMENLAKNTWIKDNKNPNISIKYFYGGLDLKLNPLPECGVDIKKGEVIENSKGDIIVGSTDSVLPEDTRTLRLSKALEYCYNNYEFDYLYKINNTALVFPRRMYEYLLSKPRKKYYDGTRNLYKYKYYFCSGFNAILSRDCVEKLVNIKEEFENSPLSEDVATGYFLLHKLEYTQFSPIGNEDPNFVPFWKVGMDPDYNPLNFTHTFHFLFRFNKYLLEKYKECYNTIV